MQVTQKAMFWVKTRALFRAGLQNLDESVIGKNLDELVIEKNGNRIDRLSQFQFKLT